MPRVFVIDPFPVEREGYATILSRKNGFEVVGLAKDLDEAAPRLPSADPDVVLLDSHVSGATWRNAGARILGLSPRSGMLLVARAADGKQVAHARGAGFRGLLLKSSSPLRIRRAIRAVAAGETFFESGAAHPPEGAAARPSPFGLTRQQLRVLELIPRGLSNRDIGAELHISEHTVKTHVTQILRKLHARDRAHAAVIALREGLV